MEISKLKEQAQDFAKLLLLATFVSYALFYYVFLTYPLNCYYSLGYLVVTFIFIFSFYQKQMLKRSCTQVCYLKENTFLAKLVTSPFLPILTSIVLALIYTVSLIYLIASLQVLLVFLGIIYIPLAAWIYFRIKSLAQKQISQKAQNIFIKNLFVLTLTLLLLITSALYNLFFGHEPKFLTDNLYSTITLAANSLNSDCIYLNFLLQIKAETSAYYWFVIKSTSQTLHNSEVKLIIWLIFLIVNTLSLVALNRLFAEIFNFLDNFLTRKNNEKS